MYDNAIFTTYQIPLTANQVDIVRHIKGPLNKRGRLVEITYVPTATTVGTLTGKVGTATDDDAHGTLTVAADVTANTVKRASADGTLPEVEGSTIEANANAVISLATAADTDDFAGDVMLTFAWF